MKYFSQFINEANEEVEVDEADSLAAMQARGEKVLAAQRKRKGTDEVDSLAAMQVRGEKVLAAQRKRKRREDNMKKEEVQYLNTENYSRIQSRGTTYSILVNWRGQMISAQMFFPKFTRPSKEEVTFEINKIYPAAKVLSFNPSMKDPTKPLLYTGDLS